MSRPDFRSRAFLLDHARSILAFYDGRCIDRELGGFFHGYRDDGSIYDRRTRHLVSSTRFVINYAEVARRLGRTGDRAIVRHGLRFLRDVHRDPRSGAYVWQLDGDTPADRTVHAYGHAFVLLAYARAFACGIEEARPWIDEVCELLERIFWRSADGLYADEADPDSLVTGAYRGQNANMHACEAMIAAFHATGDTAFLARAFLLARRVTVDLAACGGGPIWEHYDTAWQPDWGYNRNDPKHLFRPWGFQPGHQTEWAKLLLQLRAARDEAWLLPRAEEMFAWTTRHAWDDEHGGLVYGIAPDGTVCDGEKYFWVQAESLAAAARLAMATGDPVYWEWYERIWAWAWERFVDHEHGAWFRILHRDGSKIDDRKSPPGKTDYHTLGACWDVLDALLVPPPPPRGSGTPAN